MARREIGIAAIVRTANEAKNLNVNVKIEMNGGLVFMEGNRGKRKN